MPAEGNLDYALARVHARHGARLSPADWQRLEAARDLGHYLDAVRASALAGWVISLDLTCDAHAIERALRTEWRQYVEGVASWHPREWQPWLRWWAWLPILSLLAQLVRPEPAPAWMLADPVCGPAAPGSPAERGAALQGTALAPLEGAILGRVPLGAAWRAHWQALMPRSDAYTRQLLGLLLRAIDAHGARLLEDGAGAVVLRTELADRLARMFRAAAGTVIASACHLALLALDLQRLRGGLARRRVLGADSRSVA
ncbi:MAG: hypothetical protein WAN26_11770 [Steroidobacteraceae bacterium]|jgi:hypothetical protein